ncbi:DUF7373 family lipoprotein [Nocardia sp. CA-084685]|uniref:DUF7373 family lipoprotein n=1 Tax=Nocardia sp. CA-084685 TaxID=3239970 RepID=UPI003D990B56
MAAARAVCSVAVGASLVGCATVMPGAGVAGEADVRQFDIGPYPTQPPSHLPVLSGLGYAQLEAARMADAVLSPHEVESRFNGGAIARAHTDAGSVTEYLADAVVPVLQKYRFVLGFSAGAADEVVPLKSAQTGTHGRDGVTVTLLRFPDADAAKKAAAELDAADFGVSPDNVAVQLPKYSGSFAHWRPSVPTLGSVTPHGDFVINVLADSRQVDKDILIDRTQKYLDAEIPVLDQFRATPIGKFHSLQQDPDRILRRVLHDSGEIGPPDGQGEVVYTARGYQNYLLDQEGRTRVIRDAGVDRVAVTASAYVFRTRDDAAARKFVIDSVNLGDPSRRRAVDPPDGVPDVACVEDQSNTSTLRFRCFTAYHRYVGFVLSEQLWSAQQRIAAQYAWMVNAQ